MWFVIVPFTYVVVREKALTLVDPNLCSTNQCQFTICTYVHDTVSDSCRKGLGGASPLLKVMNDKMEGR